MQIIRKGDKEVLKVLGAAKVSSDDQLRLAVYVISHKQEEQQLLYNVLTGELLALGEGEIEEEKARKYLISSWFLLKSDTDDYKFQQQVRSLYTLMHRKKSAITAFTILTTTDCNARCFYCFEKNRSHIPMSEETAKKVVEYIAGHHGEEKIKLNWFGGEPLFNKGIIDYICQSLVERGIEYKSSMVSNGYLFDEETVAAAKEKWQLQEVQVTLDGTEAIYNRSKAYIYKEGSAYQRVKKNIGLLLDAGIRVDIRLNLDRHNSDDLFALVDELAEAYKGKKGLGVYSHVLFEFAGDSSHVRSAENRAGLYARQEELTEKILRLGLARTKSLERHLTINHCMADNDNGVMILPDGHLGKCEHYTDSEFIGYLDGSELDKEMIRSFKQRFDDISACQTCPVYLQCLRLKKCQEAQECFPEQRQQKINSIVRAMSAEYEQYRKTHEDENETEI